LSDFTFRSDTAISFAPSPASHTLTTPEKTRPLGSRGPSTSFIRVAQPTGGASSTPLPALLPPVPHGLSNKKRKRDSDAAATERSVEEEGNKENEAVDIADNARAVASPAKKRARVHAAVQQQQQQQQHQSVRAHASSSSTSPSRQLPVSKRKGVLSMSRLNVLARPKARR